MSQADRAIVLWLNRGAGNFGTLDRIIEWLAGDYLITAFLGFVLVLIWFGTRDQYNRMSYQIGVLVALTSMALANLIVLIINAYYFRDRPFVDLDIKLLFYEPTDSSMPSNSAAAFFGLAIAVFGFNRRFGILLLSVAGVHGLLRIYAGVHFPSDIIAGVLIGLASTFIAYRMRDLLGPLLKKVIEAARILCIA